MASRWIKKHPFIFSDKEPEDKWRGVPHLLPQDSTPAISYGSLLGGRIDPFQAPDVRGLLGSGAVHTSPPDTLVAPMEIPADTLTGAALEDAQRDLYEGLRRKHTNDMMEGKDRSWFDGDWSHSNLPELKQRDMWEQATNPAMMDTISTMMRQTGEPVEDVLSGRAEIDSLRSEFGYPPREWPVMIQDKPLPDVKFDHTRLGGYSAGGRNRLGGYAPEPGSETIFINPMLHALLGDDFRSDDGRHTTEDLLRKTMFHELGHWGQQAVSPAQEHWHPDDERGDLVDDPAINTLVPWNDIKMGAAQAVADTYTREGTSIDDVIGHALDLFWEQGHSTYPTDALRLATRSGKEEVFRNYVNEKIGDWVKNYLDIDYYRDSHPAMRDTISLSRITDYPGLLNNALKANVKY